MRRRLPKWFWLRFKKWFEIEDGYHTMREVYRHRLTLFAVVARQFTRTDPRWRERLGRSLLHADETMFDDSFIVWLVTDYGTVSYHYPLSWWNRLDFVPTHRTAPPYDGHSPDTVLERLSQHYGI